jgi:hypothetical protein
MHTGSALLETWIPHGGFKIDRRQHLVPAHLLSTWTDKDLIPARPFEDQPCFHRVLAGCPPDPAAILRLANLYGLLFASGKSLNGGEPLDLWRREIWALVRFSELLDKGKDGGKDGGKASDQLSRKLAEKLATVRFQLAVPDGGRFLLRYRAARLIDAVWQRFAEELAGLIACARCPECQRWFLKSAGRGDRRFCSHSCKMRAWRQAAT